MCVYVHVTVCGLSPFSHKIGKALGKYELEIYFLQIKKVNRIAVYKGFVNPSMGSI